MSKRQLFKAYINYIYHLIFNIIHCVVSIVSCESYVCLKSCLANHSYSITAFCYRSPHFSLFVTSLFRSPPHPPPSRTAGIYLQILIRIVLQDISRFTIIFTIFWITFAGSFYLVLVGTPLETDGGKTGTSLDANSIARCDSVIPPPAPIEPFYPSLSVSKKIILVILVYKTAYALNGQPILTAMCEARWLCFSSFFFFLLVKW